MDHQLEPSNLVPDAEYKSQDTMQKAITVHDCLVISKSQPFTNEPPNTLHSEEELEAMLLEGLNSGEGIEVTEEFWSGKRRNLIGKVQNATR